MKEAQYLELNKKGPIIAETQSTFQPGEYVPSPIQLEPAIVDKLGIKNDYMVDKKVEVKAKGVDEFLRKQIESEGMRDSMVSYETVLSRMTDSLPESLERMVTSKRGLSVLDMLFMEAALAEEMSAHSYLSELEERYKGQHVDYLLAELEKAII